MSKTPALTLSLALATLAATHAQGAGSKGVTGGILGSVFPTSAPAGQSIACEVSVGGVKTSENRFHAPAAEKVSANFRIALPGSAKPTRPIDLTLGLNWDGGRSGANIFVYEKADKGPGAWTRADLSAIQDANVRVRPAGSVGLMAAGLSVLAECSVTREAMED